MSNKIICWDMDDTLGVLSPLAYELEGRKIHKHMPPKAMLRHGIKETLQELADSGLINIVTTSAKSEYAEFALQRTGLSPYFKRIFSRELIYHKGLGETKRFRPVAQSFGFSDAEAIENIIVVDDGIIGAAFDLDGLVLILDMSIWHAAGYTNPNFPIKAIDSCVIKAVIDEIARNGSGFNSGFRTLYERSKPSQHTGKTYDSWNGMQFELVYSLPEWRGIGSTTTIPVVFNIEGAEKELQLI